MEMQHREYTLSDDISLLQFGTVHEWLTSSYWSPGVSRETVERAAENSSLLVGAYTADETQAAYLRVVSDRTTFAWLCDVYVGEAHRKKGLAKAMVKFALDHPEHQNLRRWVLATRDAHDIYSACGFEPLLDRSKWMAIDTRQI
jgi:GNAT superfamily N-acetyltransferase